MKLVVPTILLFAAASISGLGVYLIVDMLRHPNAYPRFEHAFSGDGRPAFTVALILILIGVKIVLHLRKVSRG